MKHSTERILTTHVGSLPRPPEVKGALVARGRGEEVGNEVDERVVREVVAKSVQEQAAHGLDIVNDGEMGKTSFSVYAVERLTGFERVPGARPSYMAGTREHLGFPDYYDEVLRQRPHSGGNATHWECTGPVKYVGADSLQRELDDLRAALAAVDVEEAFLPAIGPSNVTNSNANSFYQSDDEYLVAVSEAMNQEYRAIVDAGFILQFDDPLFATYYTKHPELTLDEYIAWAEAHVEHINFALRGISPENVRFHTCYSIGFGPRVHDVELKSFVNPLLKINAGAYSFEAANPRHDHEWQLWESVKVPDGKILIPGVITNSTVLVEHPDLVAQRIIRYAERVGKENVIAGVDCGFASTAQSSDIETSVVWAKFDALAEGARIASKQLWG